MAEDPKPPPTKVVVKAKMKIDKKPADIVATFGDGFTLFLTERARLGTPLSFCQWAQKSFQAEIPLVNDFTLPTDPNEQEDAVKAQLQTLGIPPALQQTLARLLLVDIWLDALVVDTKNNAFMFGMTLDFKAKRPTAWELLPNCELEEFQLVITRAEETYKFPERPQLPDVPMIEDHESQEESEDGVGAVDTPPSPKMAKLRGGNRPQPSPD